MPEIGRKTRTEKNWKVIWFYVHLYVWFSVDLISAATCCYYFYRFGVYVNLHATQQIRNGLLLFIDCIRMQHKCISLLCSVRRTCIEQMCYAMSYAYSSLAANAHIVNNLHDKYHKKKKWKMKWKNKNEVKKEKEHHNKTKLKKRKEKKNANRIKCMKI